MEEMPTLIDCPECHGTGVVWKYIAFLGLNGEEDDGYEPAGKCRACYGAGKILSNGAPVPSHAE